MSKNIQETLELQNFVDLAFELREKRTSDKDVLVKITRAEYSQLRDNDKIYIPHPKWYKCDPKIKYTPETLHRIQELIKSKGYYSRVCENYSFDRNLKIKHINDYLSDLIIAIEDADSYRCRPIVDNYSPEQLLMIYNHNRQKHFTGKKVATKVVYKDNLVCFTFEKYIEPLCVICKSEKADRGYKRCSHVCMCIDCYEKHTNTDKVPECPLCRTTVMHKPDLGTCYKCTQKFYLGPFYKRGTSYICRTCRSYSG